MTDKEVIKTLKNLEMGFLIWKEDEEALGRAIEVMEKEDKVNEKIESLIKMYQECSDNLLKEAKDFDNMLEKEKSEYLLGYHLCYERVIGDLNRLFKEKEDGYTNC